MRSAILLLLTLVAAVAHAAIAPERTEKIRTLLRDKKLVEAEAAASALVATQPAEAEAHAVLGSIRAAKGDVDGAVKAWEKAAELAPKNGEYQRQLGEAYGQAASKAGMLSKMSLGKKALAAFEKAVELDPKNLAARSSLMAVYQQAPSMMGGGIDKAFTQAAAIKQLDATRGRIAYATLYAGEKKYAEAFTELEEVLKTSPDDYPALYQLGRLAAISGERVDRGLEVLKRCLTLPAPAGPQAHDAVHWRLGNLWEKKGDKKAARVAYQAALAVNPGFPQAIEALKKLD